MAIVLMQIGSFQFEAHTAAYDALRRHSEYRWASVPRFGRAPGKQFTGPGNDSIEIKGTIYPSWHSGLHQVDDMRALALEGKPQRMVAMPSINLGVDLGLWVIESIEEEQEAIKSGGVPGRQRFRMQLSAYGEDA